jgi:hypothetical protein
VNTVDGVSTYSAYVASVTRTTVDVARSKGESIPLGWARDKDGNPTTDPVAARQGFLEPVGDHKVSTQESSAVFTSKTRSAGHLDGNVNSSCIDVPYLP